MLGKRLIFSRSLLIPALVGALTVPMTTATAATQISGIRRADRTVLAAYSGKRGQQLVVKHNGQKLSLYSFSRDSAGKSACYGKCARTWHPLLARGKLVAARGSHIKARQLRTFKRRDGSVQVMYYGQPLYLCRKNTKSGQIYGADSYQYGGSWGVMGVYGGVLSGAGYNGAPHVPAC